MLFRSVSQSRYGRFYGSIITDLNTSQASNSGVLRVLTSGYQPINRPSESNYFHGIEFTSLIGANDGYKGQFGVQSTASESNAFQLRVTNADGTWNSWRRVYHSGNSNLSTVDWTMKNLSVNGTATGTQDATLSNQFVRLGQLSSYLPTSRNLTINGTTYDLSSDRTWNVGTVTSIATGLGLSGGTITTTGAIALDTASTVVLSRQRAVNTYQPKGTYQTGTESYISCLS